MSTSTATARDSLPRAPEPAPTPVVSVSPVTVPTSGRAVDLEVRVTAPVIGGDLPVISLSHGQGQSHHLSSLNGYAPLADAYAAGAQAHA